MDQKLADASAEAAGKQAALAAAVKRQLTDLTDQLTTQVNVCELCSMMTVNCMDTNNLIWGVHACRRRTKQLDW